MKRKAIKIFQFIASFQIKRDVDSSFLFMGFLWKFQIYEISALGSLTFDSPKHFKSIDL